MLLPSKKRERKRGVILTDRGLKKLNQAKIEAENARGFKRYTLESLSEKTGLTPTTLSKIFTGSAGVDKRTLKCCFEAFHLTLLAEDYLYRSEDRAVDLPLTLSLPPNMDRSLDESASRFPTVPGGQMPLDSLFYIDRPILESLCYEAIAQIGASLNIRAPKQMGKSSLMTRILVRGRSLGYHTISVNLQLADGEILQNLERFLQWFCARVGKQLGLPNSIADVWDRSLGSKANATDYFEKFLLSHLDRPLVMAIDELNHLVPHPDIAQEFFLLLRTWSERAKMGASEDNPWHKLRLVTVYSTEILLPPSIEPSLLNTGLVIELPEFTPAQVQDLAERYEQKFTRPEIDRLIAFLGGHPYRLQLAFYYFQQGTLTLEELLDNTQIALDLYAEHLQQQWWNLQRYPRLQNIFAEIVGQSPPTEREAEPGFQLQQMGLVHGKGSRTSLACELFRLYFRERLQRRNE